MSPEDTIGEDILQNKSLYQIYCLLTQQSHSQQEFIPQLFYALYQLKKEPNNGSNSLEMYTSSIRHRLKSCKAILENNPECINLLRISCDDWPNLLQKRQKELEMRESVLNRLNDRVNNLRN